VTPLRDGGARLDEQAVEPLLAFYAAAGLDGVLLLGTTGEGVLLSAPERRRFAELAVSAAGRLRMIVHCGAQTTAETSRLATHAKEVGAHGVAVIAPPYFALADDELLEHFVAAAAACAPVPFYVYEYAARSGYPIPVAVIERLGQQVPNLAGMKVSDSPFELVKPYLETGLDVFIGAEELIPEGLTHGAAGAVSGVAAAFPEAVAALVRAPGAEQHALVAALRRALSQWPFQASVKAALGLREVSVRGDVRAPLRALAPQAVPELRRVLESVLGADGLARPLPV
jgi:dihydrodipicolinate synthase/N-acetylneuraminate lyase